MTFGTGHWEPGEGHFLHGLFTNLSRDESSRRRLALPSGLRIQEEVGKSQGTPFFGRYEPE